MYLKRLQPRRATINQVTPNDWDTRWLSRRSHQACRCSSLFHCFEINTESVIQQVMRYKQLFRSICWVCREKEMTAPFGLHWTMTLALSRFVNHWWNRSTLSKVSLRVLRDPVETADERHRWPWQRETSSVWLIRPFFRRETEKKMSCRSVLLCLIISQWNEQDILAWWSLKLGEDDSGRAKAHVIIRSIFYSIKHIHVSQLIPLDVSIIAQDKHALLRLDWQLTSRVDDAHLSAHIRREREKRETYPSFSSGFRSAHVHPDALTTNTTMQVSHYCLVLLGLVAISRWVTSSIGRSLIGFFLVRDTLIDCTRQIATITVWIWPIISTESEPLSLLIWNDIFVIWLPWILKMTTPMTSRRHSNDDPKLLPKVIHENSWANRRVLLRQRVGRVSQQ